MTMSRLALVACLLTSSAAFAAETTPLGAIKGGNADGSIPAWTGGITKPPAGYSVGDHHPDPFAGDAVKFTITAANMVPYADKLTEGHKALFAKYPGYKMNVFPTRRSAAFPAAVYDALSQNAKSAKLVEDGNGVEGSAVTSPFPNPKTGQEVVWNHLLRFRGLSFERTVGQANPTADGSYTMININEKALFAYSSGLPGNTLLYFIQTIQSPARLAGEILLVHDTLNQVKELRSAWTYNPGQRRVRRAPNVAYDNPGTASDGMRTNDQLDMYNGALDRYDWTLVGRKEMYVPYNSYKLHSDKVKYKDIIGKGHINQDLARYELHRVWVVEGDVKKGTNHIYKKRRFYVDEDSWMIIAADLYDGRGQIWRVQESHGINYYEVPVYWSTLDTSYDLQSGRYTAFGFDNEGPMYNFSARFTPEDFNPNTLRVEGTR
jgi:hypothetical protein